MKFIGTVNSNGKFCPQTPTLFKQCFEALEGKDVEVSVKEYHLPRTTPQNAYYWGVVVRFATLAINDLGNEFSEDQVHDLFKQFFLAEKKQLVNPNTAEVIEKEFTKSTTALNTIEFNEYLEKCKQWCAETIGLAIPDPIFL